ncbi:hypothetical protein J7395_07005 [Thalassospira sp. A3_1]|nr:hypothetical protein [Thalassospira sp. A3_1]
MEWSRPALPRDFTARYAMEELVVELGAAFLCGDLGLSSESGIGHA